MSSSENKIDRADITLYGISYECPALNRSSDCPLMEIDALPFCEKVEWINKLTPEQKDRIRNHHKICTKNSLPDANFKI